MAPTRIVLALAAAVAASLVGASGAPQAQRLQTGVKHYLWALGGGGSSRPPAAGGDLTWRGGAAGDGAIGVESSPRVYVVFWGPAWAKGFSIADTGGRTYSSRSLRRYVTSFFSSVGGSAWAGVQTQYCSGARPGASSCGAGAAYVANPPHQLRGVWIDPSPVPAAALAGGPSAHVAPDPVAAEALRAAEHFGSDPQATYFVLAQPGGREPGGVPWCGYHTQAVAADAQGSPIRLQYAFVPWLNRDWPGEGPRACGAHRVNRASDAFGNGVFDGYSIVLGHEYAEAITDPDNFSNVQDGWNDGYSTETGDKCAWHELRNVVLGAHLFAVQPLWSNEAFDAGRDGCAVSRVAP